MNRIIIIALPFAVSASLILADLASAMPYGKG
jgi:hypothetical protein